MTINTGSARYIPELAMIELHKIYLYIIISLEGENQRFIKITQAGPVSMDTNLDIFDTEADSLVLLNRKLSRVRKNNRFLQETGFMSTGHKFLT